MDLENIDENGSASPSANLGNQPPFVEVREDAKSEVSNAQGENSISSELGVVNAPVIEKKPARLPIKTIRGQVKYVEALVDDVLNGPQSKPRTVRYALVSGVPLLLVGYWKPTIS